MRHTEFLQRLVADVRSALPLHLQEFQTRYQGNLVKLFYASPAVHYEAWLRSNGFVEVGLHFEADQATNERLLRYFGERALDVISQLGPQVEIEQWTKSWGRVHQTMSYSVLNERLLAMTVQRMAVMIRVLQPMLEEA